MRSTYIENVYNDIDDDGRIRYGFRIDGTVNGRLSCRFLHQIPIIDEEKIKAGKHVMRDIFGEDDGYCYFYSDYSQIELRIFAILAQEEEYIKAFKSGEDVHKYTTAAMLDIPLDKVSLFNRVHIGKRFNFGIIYGSQGYNISKGVFEDPENPGVFHPLDFGTVQGFVRNYKNKYKKIDFFLQYIPDLARSQGCTLQSVFGRERHLPLLNDADKSKRAAAEREAVSFIVQSPAGALTVRTINAVDQMLEGSNVGLDRVSLLNSVHDSTAYGVRKDIIDWFSSAYKTIAERPIPQLGNNTFPVDFGWSDYSWARAELAAK